MKLVHLAVLLFMMLYVFSCKDDNITYAEELKAEQELISDFISRQNIQVVTVMPADFPWPENVYYKSESGLYFRLTNQGDVASDSIEFGDLIVPRYIQYTLTENPDTVWNLNTVDKPYPATFNYLDRSNTNACEGWQEAVGYMKHHQAEAKLIVYSKLGFNQFSSPATPIGYDMKIKVQK